MKKIIIIQTITFLFFNIIIFFCFSLNASEIRAFFIGSFFSIFNFFLLALLWNMILKKKFVALCTSVIVIKYLVVFIFFYIIVKSKIFDVLFLLLGITSILFGFLLYVIFCLLETKKIHIKQIKQT